MTSLIPVPVSPLRRCLIEDLEMRRFGRETQRNYIRDVGRFATFLVRPPDTATAENVRRFQVEQRDLGVSTSCSSRWVAKIFRSIPACIRDRFTDQTGNRQVDGILQC